MEPTSAPGLDTPLQAKDGSPSCTPQGASPSQPSLDTTAPGGCTVPSHWLSKALDLWLQDSTHATPGMNTAASH
jgi:hypothetical protein